MDISNMPQLDTAVQEDSPESIVKAAKKLFSGMGFRLLIGTVLMYVICYGVQDLLMYILSVNNPDLAAKIAGDYTYSLIFSISIQYILATPPLVFLLSVKMPVKAPEKRKVGFGWCVVFFIISYSLMYSSNMLGTALNAIISSFSGNTISSYAVQDIVRNANLGVVCICTVLLAPVIEEMIFRKMIVDRCGQYGEAASALMSGIVFGLFHGNLTQGIYAFCLGYFLALIYNKTGKIYITIGIHMVINFMGSFIPIKLLEIVNIDMLNEIDMNNDAELMNYFAKNGYGVVLLLLYAMVVVGLVVAGIILMIVNRKKFMPHAGEIRLPRHKTFSVVVGNVGMILFIVASFAYIVYTFVIGLRH